ncbi:hypothetical protein [Corynebacterium belfantii]|nr:hypothetical protein [Corynebacterium belfantii]STC67782.1 Uncharacterised protein [Corynebacterium diphtheriae]
MSSLSMFVHNLLGLVEDIFEGHGILDSLLYFFKNLFPGETMPF